MLQKIPLLSMLNRRVRSLALMLRIFKSAHSAS